MWDSSKKNKGLSDTDYTTRNCMKNYWITWIGELTPLNPETAFIINIINFPEQEDSKSEKAQKDLLKLDGIASMDVLQGSANWTVTW